MCTRIFSPAGLAQAAGPRRGWRKPRARASAVKLFKPGLAQPAWPRRARAAAQAPRTML